MVCLMLEKIAKIDLKYIHKNHEFKIATWFRKLLAAIPNGEGLDRVKYLCFPHMHWFDESMRPAARINPSIELMIACRRLRKVDMTLSVFKVAMRDMNTNWNFVPHSVSYLMDRYGLHALSECVALREIYIDGCYVAPGRGGSPRHLDALENLGKYIKKDFLVRGQSVRVELVRRWGSWRGRMAGVILTLSPQELADVERQIAINEGRLSLHRSQK